MFISKSHVNYELHCDKKKLKLKYEAFGSSSGMYCLDIAFYIFDDFSSLFFKTSTLCHHYRKYLSIWFSLRYHHNKHKTFYFHIDK